MSLQPEKFSRLRLFGKRIRNRDLAQFVATQLNGQKKSKAELAKELGTSRVTINELCRLATDTGLEVAPKQVRIDAELEADLEEFQKIGEVQQWAEWMNGRLTKTGKPFPAAEARTYLINFYAVCITLKTHPAQFLYGADIKTTLDNARGMMEEFIKRYQAGTAKIKKTNVDTTRADVITGAAYRYSKAVRDFMKFHGYQFPTGETGVMSQSIAPFHGKYAKIRMTEETYQKIKDELEAEYSTHSDIWVYFVYGIEAFPRRQSIQETLCKYEEIEANGKTILITENFESKTAHYKNGMWEKHIFDPKLHDEIKSRKAAGYNFLFSDQTRDNDDYIVDILKEKYRKYGLTEQGQKTRGDPETSYFIRKPVHCLRHCGAQRLLRATGWNVAYVAKRGWKKPQELIDSYGEIPADIEHKMLGAVEF